MLVHLYHAEPINREELLAWIKTQREHVAPYIGDVSLYLNDAIKEGKNIEIELPLFLQ